MMVSSSTSRWHKRCGKPALKQGKATHIKAFQTKAEALEAVGLRE